MRKSLLILGVLSGVCLGSTDSYSAPRGYVPDAATAVAIAVAAWKPIYGAKDIEAERPFVARLRGGVWYVSGTLPKDAIGGTARAEIAEKDGRILRVSHGQ